ncbi:SUKH-4 family immunity protein [Kitasatospora sp. NPDC050463]|uniref:SUKH-4 family immunity protein n=1 Tax=Kitasatospora sp. NPDC050463 TaxID=3155786 RepID=UPI0033E28A9A
MNIEAHWDGRLRLGSAGLPEELSHQPSRTFLAGEGLPEKGAFLDFAALDAPPLGVLGSGPTERLFVLGETGYVAATDYEGDAVLLDGATGEVFLAARRRGGRHDGLRRDLIASSLPALVELMREVDAVAVAAAEPAALDGYRGPAVVAEVVGVARRRMRAIDPELFDRADDAPPHWDTALLVRSLSWGALPGGPGALAYELGPELVQDLAALGADGLVRRYRPEELPDRLTHGPTRRLLAEVGLPLGGGLLTVSDDEPLRTMAEAYPEHFTPDAPSDAPAHTSVATPSDGFPLDARSDRPGVSPQNRDHQRDHLAVGDWPDDLVVALDGATGRLELPDWNEAGEPEAYLNRDLSALLYSLWVCERLRAEWRRWEYGRAAGSWEVFDPQSLLSGVVEDVIAAIDPEAFATPGHSWQLLADDAHMGGLLN